MRVLLAMMSGMLVGGCCEEFCLQHPELCGLPGEEVSEVPHGQEMAYVCVDGEDNDHDGRMDLEDPDCAGKRCDPSGVSNTCDDGDDVTPDWCDPMWWCRHEPEPADPEDGLVFCGESRIGRCAGCSEWISAQETCVLVFDEAQTWSDADGDGVPQVDQRSEGWSVLIDNCPEAANSDQSDVDGDGVGDACDQN